MFLLTTLTTEGERCGGKPASALLLSIALLFFFFSITPPCSANQGERLTGGPADGGVYLLAGVCGDSQAVGHQAGCFVLLHQPDRNDGDGHLGDRRTDSVRI